MSYAPSVIAAVLTPRLSALFVTDRARHRRLALLGVAASTALAVLIGAVAYQLAEPLMTWLFGGDFAAAARPFRILCVGLGFVFAIWVLHAIAISVNRERLLLTTGIIGLVVNVALNLYLIPHQGASGAAIATIAGEGVSLIVLVIGLWVRDADSTRAVRPVVLSCPTSIRPAGGIRTRFNLVRAITNDHSLQVDPYHQHRRQAFRALLLDKAPGLSFTACRS
jgi:O-antigen/teichoic acid export membrane protein